MSIIISVLLVVLVLLPFLKKSNDRESLELADKHYDILKKSVEDAVNHVHQVSGGKDTDMTGEQKKELAIKVAKDIATKVGVSADQQELVGNLIESVLWKQLEVDEDVDTYD